MTRDFLQHLPPKLEAGPDQIWRVASARSRSDAGASLMVFILPEPRGERQRAQITLFVMVTVNSSLFGEGNEWLSCVGGRTSGHRAPSAKGVGCSELFCFGLRFIPFTRVCFTFDRMPTMPPRPVAQSGATLVRGCGFP